MASPHYAVERLLDELQIAGSEDLQRLDLIAFARGAIVRYRSLEGAEARLSIVGGRAIVTVSEIIHNPQRRRFSVAHELGHLELHRWRQKMFLCTSKDIDDWQSQRTNANLEQEANEFAAELLLPERFFASLCTRAEPSLDFIAQLAGTFNVSLTATSRRFVRFCGEACAVVFSQDGYIRWFQASSEFENMELFIEVRCRPAHSSLAAACLANRALQPTPKRVRALDWFAPGQYREDATILEQSWGMPNYNAALTLLWVDDGIEEDDFW